MSLPLIALTHHAEETLTDAEFELEILRHMGTEALFDKASRDKAKQAVKDAASSGYAKSKAGAKQAAEAAAAQARKSGKEAGQYARRTMAGAKLPNTWQTSNDKELAKRLSKSYKMYIEELGWKQIQVAAENYRVVYAESGLMVHAKIIFTKTSTRVYLVDSILGSTKELMDYISYKDGMSFSELTKQVDNLIKTMAFKFVN